MNYMTLFNKKKLPVFPIFVDSPLAVNVTEVYRLHPECFDRETYTSLSITMKIRLVSADLLIPVT